MSKVIILRGVPGSGKSTFCEGFKMNAAPWEWVGVLSRDLIRKRLFGDEGAHGVNENMVTEEFNKDYHYYIDRFVEYDSRKDLNFTLIIDNTNCDWSRVEELATLPKMYGIDVEIVTIDTDLDEALRRNAARDRVVPEHVIRRMHDQLTETKGWTL